jgi:hypothetical protein
MRMRKDKISIRVREIIKMRYLRNEIMTHILKLSGR